LQQRGVGEFSNAGPASASLHFVREIAGKPQVAASYSSVLAKMCHYKTKAPDDGGAFIFLRATIDRCFGPDQQEDVVRTVL
jgi:hypothetical protein